MTVRDYRDRRDRQRGTDRKELYGSDRAHFPFPSKLTSKNSRSTKIGAPGALIRKNDYVETTNYERVQQLNKMMSMFG